jgi:hypothetical protein
MPWNEHYNFGDYHARTGNAILTTMKGPHRNVVSVPATSVRILISLD